MNLMLAIQLLLLLFIANGVPILLKRALGASGDWPVDLGWQWPADDRRLFGASKTWRGLMGAVLGAGLAAFLMNVPIRIGLVMGLWAMLGDLLSSFLKRRAGLIPGAMALGLDQIPESLFPLLAVRADMALPVLAIAALVLLFGVMELLISRLLFAWHIRERPY